MPFAAAFSPDLAPKLQEMNPKSSIFPSGEELANLFEAYGAAVYESAAEASLVLLFATAAIGPGFGPGSQAMRAYE